MRVWIDIENPPQVQYLVPFKAAFEAVGADVVVTARDYDVAYRLLRARGVDFEPIGSSYGKGKRQKLTGLVRRTHALTRFVRQGEKPAALICSGRASTLAARRMGVASFVIEDYEHSHEALYRLAGSYIVHPDVIDPAVFRAQGIRANRLVPFPGIKEDLSFANVDVDAQPPHLFDELRGREELVRVLFRPPAEEAHYHREASGSLGLRTLEYLAGQDRAVVIFAPRYPWQVQYIERLQWRNEPIVLRDVVPFVPLLRGIDAVVSGGGTMLREAAYLGVPAFSIFRGELGGVDRHLAAIGRLHLVDSPDALKQLRFDRRARAQMLRSDPGLLAHLVQLILARTRAHDAVSWPNERPHPVPSAVAARRARG